ncbi:MAG TPA: tetratricopeptide repeat protein [Anaerolineae bacterium]
MPVSEMERRFYELKGKLDVGALDEEAFKTEIEKLRFQDAQNRWWMIGAQSGKWYMYDGTRWVPGQPPDEPPEPPPAPPEASPVVQPVPTDQAPPASAAPPVSPTVAHEESRYGTEPALPESLPMGQPVHLPSAQAGSPARPRPVRARRAAFPTPIGPVVIIGCAMLAALVFIIFAWFAVETFIPGKPISSTIANLLRGGSPSSTTVPGRPAATPTVANPSINQMITAGDDFVLKSQFDTAVAQYQAAAQMAANNPVPLWHWSRALVFRGQMQDALAKANQASQRAPNDAETQAQLARMLAWTGQINGAVLAGEKAVQLDPKSSNAHAYLAEIYLLARRPNDAQTQAQLALQIASQSAEAHRAQAWVLTAIGQKEAALVEWRQTVALEPNLSFRHFELGEVLRLFFNDPINAASEYQKVIALYGAYIPAYSRLGLALLDANQPQQAIPQFQRTITLDPNNPDGYAYLGLAFGKANQCPQAIPYFEQALKLNAGHALAVKGLAECQSGKVPSAPASAAPAAPLIPPTIAPTGR